MWPRLLLTRGSCLKRLQRAGNPAGKSREDGAFLDSFRLLHLGPFVLGFSPQLHPTRDRIKLCHQVQPLELQMQVPVAKTSELEVLGFPGPVLCRLDGVDDAS